MLITEKLLMDGQSSPNGWTSEQVKLLGVGPMRKGWRQRAIGRQISEENAARFLELGRGHADKVRRREKNKRRKQRRPDKHPQPTCVYNPPLPVDPLLFEALAEVLAGYNLELVWHTSTHWQVVRYDDALVLVDVWPTKRKFLRRVTVGDRRERFKRGVRASIGDPFDILAAARQVSAKRHGYLDISVSIRYYEKRPGKQVWTPLRRVLEAQPTPA